MSSFQFSLPERVAKANTGGITIIAIKCKEEIRKCLICDLEFLSLMDWICSRCHEKYKRVFEDCPEKNYERLI